MFQNQVPEHGKGTIRRGSDSVAIQLAHRMVESFAGNRAQWTKKHAFFAQGGERHVQASLDCTTMEAKPGRRTSASNVCHCIRAPNRQQKNKIPFSDLRKIGFFALASTGPSFLIAGLSALLFARCATSVADLRLTYAQVRILPCVCGSEVIGQRANEKNQGIVLLGAVPLELSHGVISMLPTMYRD